MDELMDELVSPRWLHAHLQDPRLRILDVRVREELGRGADGSEATVRVAARDEYEAGHIPGAQFVALEELVHDDGVAARVVAPQRVQELAWRVGIGPDSLVVVYDGAGGSAATRVWWTLRLYGHRQVAVLDGGWQAWQAFGLPATTQPPPAYPPGTWRPERRAGWEIDLRGVFAALAARQAVLVDTREAASFAAGHLPGAVNVPASQMRAADGQGFRSLRELEQLFAARGVPPDRGQRLVVYCRTGMSATVGAFHLRRLGYGQVEVYPGSWNEWRLVMGAAAGPGGRCHGV